MNTKPETKTNEYLKGIVSNLPEKPGVYQYLNTEGTIIYVGKAKNLKKRVYSYFSKEHEPGKTRVLVSKIADIRYIVVNTEEDALLLENNLIKKYKPRYNVLLKDDKTYPSICVQNEYFPRVFRTRKIIRNGSSYYGPYSHIPSMYALLDLIKHLYPLRTCTLNLSPENIRAGKFKVCLEYHIKKCAGPCVGLQSQDDYLKNIDEIKEILKGNTQDISRMLLEKMQDVPAERRGAKFVAAVCFILPTGRHLTCRGECPGKVAFARLAGDYGFGYDPLFIPDECGVGKAEKRPNTEGRSYAQLTPDEKDAISHRGVALAKLEKELPEFLK